MNTRSKPVLAPRLFPLLAAAVFGFSPGPALAAPGDCAQPVSAGANIAATDCLFILKVAVGSESCNPECICAPKGRLPVSASDALLCLQAAVGSAPPLDCPCSQDGFTGEAVAFINEVEMPTVNIEDEGDDFTVDCCKDFGAISEDFVVNGTDLIDNRLAVLSTLLTIISGSDVIVSVNHQIERGNLVLLLDHRGVNTGNPQDPLTSPSFRPTTRHRPTTTKRPPATVSSSSTR